MNPETPDHSKFHSPKRKRSFQVGRNNLCTPTMKIVVQVITTTEKTEKQLIADQIAQHLHRTFMGEKL